MVLGRAYQPPQRRPMDLARHHLETIWPEKKSRETSQAVERRPGQILERHDMAEDSTRQGHLETTCWGLRPTTGHNGCLMMMMMIVLPRMFSWRVIVKAMKGYTQQLTQSVCITTYYRCHVQVVTHSFVVHRNILCLWLVTTQTWRNSNMIQWTERWLVSRPNSKVSIHAR